MKKIFENGATWVRADFHLHTKADNAFPYNEDPNSYVTKYIEQLKSEEIRIAVITNHNKFDLAEFKELRKNAEREEIYMLPGVEFSVKDGAKGLHILIVFNDEWIYNAERANHIQQFLDAAFLGISNYENPPYVNSKLNLEGAYESLNAFGKDYFFILAHIDDQNGLFEELKGRNLEDCICSETFDKKVLALQKSRKNDNRKRLQDLLPKKKLAFVEGTDSAHNGIEGIGKGNEVSGKTQMTFLKTGAYNFDALKFALLDPDNRVSPIRTELDKAFLKSITFTTGKWKGKKIAFNAAMNNLIGIRGSGKSTILETVRYALDIPIGNNAHEPEYKEKLVQNFLGSGGKMEIELEDHHGKKYIAEKIYGEATSIYQNGELQHNLRTNAIISKPLYYGQKDLSDIGGETSTEDLINKLMGDKIKPIRQQIEEQSSQVINLIAELRKIDKQLATKEEIEARKAAIEKDIKIFKELEIDKKLNKQIEYNKDSNRFDNILEFEDTVIEAMQSLHNEYKDSFAGYAIYESKENADLFKQSFESYGRFQKAFLQLVDIIKLLQTEKKNLEQIKRVFLQKYDQLKEEFSEVKRTINLPNIEADTYVKLSKDLDFQNEKLVEIKKLADKKTTLRKNLNQALTNLRSLWHKEFVLIREEVDKLNKDQGSIQIDVKFKENKDKFKEYIKTYVKGSGLRGDLIDTIADIYPDLIEVYNDFGIASSQINTLLSGGNNLANFRTKFDENINSFLTYRVPDKFIVLYKGRPLGEHSLGQRASALIIFILTLKENALIIIDQPEDDLDNQTIYSDVISELKKLKDQTQFIFATHNPNIPVLGDCEQIISCSYNNNLIETVVGSIDNTVIQEKIVDIMEGGEDAFKQRKLIYELWKH
ncbi:MAG: TrlF family AAA-like ATPase [Bacteroidota bacterium]